MVAGGVDLLWVETMSDEAEVKAAVAAARATGLPVVCTMSFDTHQRTMMGVAPADFAGFWVTGDGASNALGANCGIGPAEALDTVLDIAAAAPFWRPGGQGQLRGAVYRPGRGVLSGGARDHGRLCVFGA